MPARPVTWLLILLVLPTFSLLGGLLPEEQQSPPATRLAAVETQESAKSAASADTQAASAKSASESEQDLSWMPKAETGALRFLKEHPEADGRNVVVAIFDTGVDPGAIGLQTTPDGRPKVIDIVDGTGSGDVAMTRVVQAEEKTITGLSGRVLKLGENWENPTGDYRVGLKSGYELFPSELVHVVKAERERKFRQKQAAQRAELQRELQAWEKAHPKPDDKQKREKKELQARIALVDELLGSYKDPGPMYDCVVFHDGTHYRAVIDTDQDGDLGNEKLLTNFREERQYGTFPDPINLNFGVNVYDSGELLSIVADTGAHGTHVAGIVAAYFPDKPEWNGVAPGAQIVSVKIGDTRLDGMESGPGLVRGVKAVLENKCDLINMSYGEPTTTPGLGRVAELYAELVKEHDVLFVSSAGNAGPALTTAGAPGGTTSEILGVGAYVSPEMMRSEYTLREKLPGLPYTWTSRGPTSDGDLGVDIFAPGGAFAPVPIWTRQVSQQMNGTSMASPNACGNIALMMSAAKAQGLAYTPYSVRRAIQNTAQQLEHADVFGAGPGLIQVDQAWDYLVSRAESKAGALRYDVSVPALKNARGIYLREQHHTRHAANYRVTVQAGLKKEAPIEQRLDIDFSLNLQATADWVKVGDLLHLTHGGNRFDIEVDPTGLSPGVHYAEVQALEMADPEAGPVFRVPITVIIPENDKEQLDPLTPWKQQGTFEPGIVHRHFVQPPAGATWAELKMKLVETPDVKFFRVHTMQLIEGTPFKHGEAESYYPLNSDEQTTHTFPIYPGKMLEIAVAQFWSILGTSQMEYELTFHGVRPDSRQISLATGEGVKPITLVNELAPETISPKGSLTTWRRTLAPKKSEIVGLNPDRDLLPDGSSMYELRIEYELKMASAGNPKLRLLPLEDLLYDAPIGPFIYHIFDKHGRRLTTNDMFPDPFSLQAGTYRVQVLVQHHQVSELKRFEKLPLTVDQPLSSPISLKFWASPADAASNRSGRIGGMLRTGAAITYYVGEPDASALPSALSPGDRLLGEIKFSADDDAATEFTAEYTYAQPAQAGASASDSSASGSLDKQLRAVKLQHLKTLDPTGEDFAKLFEELREADPEDRQPLTIKLERLDTDEDRKSRLEAVITAADELLATFDQNQIAATLGKRVPADDKEARQAHEQAEKDKKLLIDTLYRRARAIAYRELPEVIEENPIEDQAAQDQQFADALKALEGWADLSEAPHYLLKVRQHRRQQEYAQAIQLLNKHLKPDSALLHFKKRRDMLQELGWDDWADWQQQQMLLHFPNEHPPYE